MIKRDINACIKLSPRELEHELWSMTTIEQVDFLLAMAQRMENEHGKACMQLENLSAELSKSLLDNEIASVKYILQSILEELE